MSASTGLLDRLPLLEAASDPATQAARIADLWRTWDEAPPDTREAARTLLDGRYRPFLDLIDTHRGDDERRGTVAAAWLDRSFPTPEVETVDEHDHARTALALACGGHDDLLREAARHPPALVMAAVRSALRALLHDHPEAPHCAAVDPQQLHAASQQAQQQDPSLIPAGLCRLFELAVLVDDEATAIEALALVIHHRLSVQLDLQALRLWLEAGPLTPLRLDRRAGHDGLDARGLLDAAWRQRLLQALHRHLPRRRWSAVMQALASFHPTPGDEPDGPRTPLPPAALHALDRLASIDRCHHALAQADRTDGIAQARQLLRDPHLHPQTRSALAHQLALAHLEAGDLWSAWSRWSAALRDWPSAAVLEQMDLLLQTLGVSGARHWLAADPLEQLPRWQALERADHPTLQWLARYQLAQLHTHGRLAPTHRHKVQDARQALALWGRLQNLPAWQAEATAALSAPGTRALAALARDDGGRHHLWIEAPEPGTRRLLIVFSCVDSHHSHPGVIGLVNGMPDHHLLFVNNPELNWYSDEVFEQLCTLVRRKVLPRLRPEDVTCYYGSMGGHGALKLALTFGFQAVVFNPQVELALWSAYRPRQRDLLLGARRHHGIVPLGSDALAASPIAIAVGSGTPDRLAFSALVGMMATARALTLLVDKVPDPHHAGLIGRLTRRGVPTLVHHLATRLQQLHRIDDPGTASGFEPVEPTAVAGFWAQMDQAAHWQGEVLVRGGRLHCRRHHPAGRPGLARMSSLVEPAA